MKGRQFPFSAVVVTLLASSAVLHAQGSVGTAFTYQGQLKQSDVPVAGQTDFKFRLFDDPNGGNQVGPELVFDGQDDNPQPVDVDNGLFAVGLDFGDGIFTGDARWLEIDVRYPHDPTDSLPYTPLSPRQELTPAPYAIYPDGHSLDAADGSPMDVVYVDDGGRVGIGNASGLSKLEVWDGNIRVRDSNDDTRVVVYRFSDPDDFGGLETFTTNGGSRNCVLTALVDDTRNGYVAVAGSHDIVRAGMYVDTDGNGIVWGDTKSFRTPNPVDPDTEIWYACIEGPEAAAYLRGTSHLVGGRAAVEFPEHFKVVAAERGMTVQVTPLSGESNGLAVTAKSLDGVVVEELNGGVGSYAFDYLVMAVRAGYEDYRVIRDAHEARPAAMMEARQDREHRIKEPKDGSEASDVALDSTASSVSGPAEQTAPDVPPNKDLLGRLVAGQQRQIAQLQADNAELATRLARLEALIGDLLDEPAGGQR